MKRGATEIRLNEDGTVDEVIGWGYVHLEQMDAGSWLMIFETVDRRRLHVNFWTKRNATIHVRTENDGASDYADPLCEGVAQAIARDHRRINKNRKAMGWPALGRERHHLIYVDEQLGAKLRQRQHRGESFRGVIERLLATAPPRRTPSKRRTT